jgi:ribosomal protein S13
VIMSDVQNEIESVEKVLVAPDSVAVGDVSLPSHAAEGVANSNIIKTDSCKSDTASEFAPDADGVKGSENETCPPLAEGSDSSDEEVSQQGDDVNSSIDAESDTAEDSSEGGLGAGSVDFQGTPEHQRTSAERCILTAHKMHQARNTGNVEPFDADGSYVAPVRDGGAVSHKDGGTIPNTAAFRNYRDSIESTEYMEKLGQERASKSMNPFGVILAPKRKKDFGRSSMALRSKSSSDVPGHADPHDLQDIITGAGDLEGTTRMKQQASVAAAFMEASSKAMEGAKRGAAEAVTVAKQTSGDILRKDSHLGEEGPVETEQPSLLGCGLFSRVPPPPGMVGGKRLTSKLEMTAEDEDALVEISRSISGALIGYIKGDYPVVEHDKRENLLEQIGFQYFSEHCCETYQRLYTAYMADQWDVARKSSEDLGVRQGKTDAILEFMSSGEGGLGSKVVEVARMQDLFSDAVYARIDQDWAKTNSRLQLVEGENAMAVGLDARLGALDAATSDRFRRLEDGTEGTQVTKMEEQLKALELCYSKNRLHSMNSRVEVLKSRVGTFDSKLDSKLDDLDERMDREMQGMQDKLSSQLLLVEQKHSAAVEGFEQRLKRLEQLHGDLLSRKDLEARLAVLPSGDTTESGVGKRVANLESTVKMDSLLFTKLDERLVKLEGFEGSGVTDQLGSRLSQLEYQSKYAQPEEGETSTRLQYLEGKTAELGGLLEMTADAVHVNRLSTDYYEQKAHIKAKFAYVDGVAINTRDDLVKRIDDSADTMLRIKDLTEKQMTAVRSELKGAQSRYTEMCTRVDGALASGFTTHPQGRLLTKPEPGLGSQVVPGALPAKTQDVGLLRMERICESTTEMCTDYESSGFPSGMGGARPKKFSKRAGGPGSSRSRDLMSGIDGGKESGASRSGSWRSGDDRSSDFINISTLDTSIIDQECLKFAYNGRMPRANLVLKDKSQLGKRSFHDAKLAVLAAEQAEIAAKEQKLAAEAERRAAEVEKGKERKRVAKLAEEQAAALRAVELQVLGQGNAQQTVMSLGKPITSGMDGLGPLTIAMPVVGVTGTVSPVLHASSPKASGRKHIPPGSFVVDRQQASPPGWGDVEQEGVQAPIGAIIPEHSFGPSQNPQQKQVGTGYDEVIMGMLGAVAQITECIKAPGAGSAGGSTKDPKVAELRKFSGQCEDLEDFLDIMDVQLNGGVWSEHQKAKNLLDHCPGPVVLSVIAIDAEAQVNYAAAKAALRAAIRPGGEMDFQTIFDTASIRPDENYFIYSLRLMKYFKRSLDGVVLSAEDCEKFVKHKWARELPANLTAMIGLQLKTPLPKLAKLLDLYVAAEAARNNTPRVTSAALVAGGAEAGAGSTATAPGYGEEDWEERPDLILYSDHKKAIGDRGAFEPAKFKNWKRDRDSQYDNKPRSKKVIKWCDMCQSSSHNAENCLTQVVAGKMDTGLKNIFDSMRVTLAESLSRMEATVKAGNPVVNQAPSKKDGKKDKKDPKE